MTDADVVTCLLPYMMSLGDLQSLAPPNSGGCGSFPPGAPFRVLLQLYSDTV